MTVLEELEPHLQKLCDTLNEANEAVRQALGNAGIKTTESLFELKENKKLLRQITETDRSLFESEKFDILFGARSKTHRPQ